MKAARESQQRCNCRRERLPEIAGLRRVGLFHLLEEKQPGIVFSLDVAFVTLSQFERLDRIT